MKAKTVHHEPVQRKNNWDRRRLIFWDLNLFWLEPNLLWLKAKVQFYEIRLYLTSRIITKFLTRVTQVIDCGKNVVKFWYIELFSVIDIKFNGIKVALPAGYPKLFTTRIPNDCPSFSNGTNCRSPPTKEWVIYMSHRSDRCTDVKNYKINVYKQTNLKHVLNKE